MFETIASMWLPLTVLLVAGTLTIGVAWWATLQAENKDDFLFGDDTQ